MAGPTCMARCRQWTVALFQKRKMKCFITEAKLVSPLSAHPAGSPAVPVYHGASLDSSVQTQGGAWQGWWPLLLWTASASMDLPTACSKTLSRHQGNQPQER